MKQYVIKDLFGILVILNVIKLVISVNICTMKIVNAEKKLADQIIDECAETIEEVRLANITLTEN